MVELVENSEFTALLVMQLSQNPKNLRPEAIRKGKKQSILTSYLEKETEGVD